MALARDSENSLHARVEGHAAQINALTQDVAETRSDVRSLRTEVADGFAQLKSAIESSRVQVQEQSENSGLKLLGWAGVVSAIIMAVGGGVFAIVQNHVGQDIGRLEKNSQTLSQKVEDMRAVDAESRTEREHMKTEVTRLRDKYYDWMMGEVEELREIRKRNLQREMWGEGTGAIKP